MARKFLTEADEAKVIKAIEEAETNTSGEIRVHIEAHCEGDPYHRAVKLFEKMGMTRTALRNGVLVYIAVEDHKFAIIGDKGIDEKVPRGFWEETQLLMREHFRKGNLGDGLVEGVLDAGEQLKKYFPYQSDDTNELKDEISYG